MRTTNSKQYLWDIRRYAKELQFGTVLAMDPGSRVPGYALFHLGEYAQSGIIQLPATATIYTRLQVLATKMAQITPVPPDVVVLEAIRNPRVHTYLYWSIGTIIGGARTAKIIELPIFEWKTTAKADVTYTKTDENDAIAIGTTAIKIARGL